jgi:hypothetical protein
MRPIMNTATESQPYRSEAFAEDVLDLVAATPEFEAPARPVQWLVNAVPVAIALIGVAFAVFPPLA